MTFTAKPRCRVVGNLLQLRYNAPYDIQCSATYPLPAPNGSSVILLGHADGLLVVWRGGRPLKAAARKAPPALPKGPTASSSDLMVIDLDSDPEDASPAARTLSAPVGPVGSAEPAEFEEEEGEIDPKAPYAPVIQTLNLGFGSGGVTHISTPVLSDAAKRGLSPELLRTHMIIAVSCEDSSVKVVKLPLHPPSDEAKARPALLKDPSLAGAGAGGWGETVVEVPKSLGHATLVDGVSVGISARSLVEDDDAEEMETDGRQRQKQSHDEAWDILVASISADAGGMLLVHRIRVDADGQGLSPTQLWRRELLDKPATAVDLYAGSATTATIYPKVLVVEAFGPVKVYECSDDESREEGRWIGELHPRQQDEDTSKATILDARFLLGSSAVIAVVNNGEWGVWDLSRLSTQARQRGFVYSNRFTTTKPSAPKTTRTALQKPQQSSLAPMTPHTRKIRQQALFSDDSETSAAQLSSKQPSSGSVVTRGGISVNITSRDPSPASEDGQIILWCGDSMIFVPNLRAYHISNLAASGGNTSALVAADDPFGAGVTSSATNAQPKPIPVPDQASLRGGSQVGVGFLLGSRSSSSGVRSRVPEVVVASEKAFSIIAYPKNADSSAWKPINKSTLATEGDESKSLVTSAATSAAGALKGGAELAIDGIESALDNMARGAKRLSGRV